MRVEPHHSADELRRLARREADGRVAVRVLAVASAAEGRTAPQVSREVGAARRSVRQWVRRYNKGGVVGLRDGGGRGRKPPLSGEERERLKARLDAGPLPGADGGVRALRGRDVQRILKQEFGKARCLSSVYGLLHAIGYNDLVPRPRHKGADPGAQEAFKKSAPN